MGVDDGRGWGWAAATGGARGSRGWGRGTAAEGGYAGPRLRGQAGHGHASRPTTPGKRHGEGGRGCDGGDYRLSDPSAHERQR